jgi:hypothetical protein
MLTVKRVKKEVDGVYKTEFAISEDQMAFLVSYAISNLVVKGLAEIEDVTEGQSDLEQLPLEFMGTQQ